MADRSLARIRSTPGKLVSPNDPRYDAAASADLQRRLRVLPGLRQNSAVAEWKLGDHYAHIKERRLYLQAGCSSFSEWLRVNGIGRTRVYELIEYSSTFSLADVKKHLSEKLWLVLEYAKLTVTDDREWMPAELVVEVPENGAIRRVRFADVTEAQLERACTHQRALAQRRAFERLPEPHQALARELAQAVGDGNRVTVSSSDPTRAELTRVSLTGPLAVFTELAERVTSVIRRGRRRG